MTRRRRDNLICTALSPRLEHIGTRCWLKLQPRIAYSAALCRAPGSGSLCRASCFQIKHGSHSFHFLSLSLALSRKPTVGWKWKESSVRKWSIHQFSISAHLLLSVTGGLHSCLVATTLAEHANMTHTHLEDFLGGTDVVRNGHAPNVAFNEATPPSPPPQAADL